MQPWIFVVYSLFGALVNGLQHARRARLGVPGAAAVYLASLLASNFVYVLVSLTSADRETLRDQPGQRSRRSPVPAPPKVRAAS